MSLNHKRRIFRPSFSVQRLLGGRTLRVLPTLAVTVGATLLFVGAWAITDAIDTPAPPALTQAAPAERMVADAARVAVVDGNTLRLEDRVVRLDGVIPPARGETCLGRDGTAFDCGVAAANALAGLLRDSPVDCTLLGSDHGGRRTAICSAGGEQLNRAVVAAGWARAGDQTLRAVEQRARAEQRGLWTMAR